MLLVEQQVGFHDFEVAGRVCERFPPTNLIHVGGGFAPAGIFLFFGGIKES